MIANPEDAVRLHMKIRLAAPRVGLVQLALVLDVKADRRLILSEHARVHREGELLALLLERRSERAQRPVGFVIRAAQEQTNVVMTRIECADSEFGAVEILRRAGRRSRAQGVR
jgi:hypothetical protein